MAVGGSNVSSTATVLEVVALVPQLFTAATEMVPELANVVIVTVFPDMLEGVHAFGTVQL